MPHIVLDRPCVVPLVGELVPAGVSEHVRVNREPELGRLPYPGDQLPDAGVRQWPLALGDEQIRGLRIVALQAPQSPDLRPADLLGLPSDRKRRSSTTD
jgi:hypothetical protein